MLNLSNSFWDAEVKVFVCTRPCSVTSNIKESPSFKCLFILLLNSSTIDELGKVTGKMLERQAQEPNVWGNHDNPVSGNHHALSHWKNSGTMILTSCLPQRGREGGREGGQGVKSLGTQWNRQRALVDLNSQAVKLHKPLQHPPPTTLHNNNRGRLLTSVVLHLS